MFRRQLRLSRFNVERRLRDPLILGVTTRAGLCLDVRPHDDMDNCEYIHPLTARP
jgi:hypothetical protein